MGALTDINGKSGGGTGSGAAALSAQGWGSSGGAEPASASSACWEGREGAFGVELWECKRAMVHLSIKQANLFSFN